MSRPVGQASCLPVAAASSRELVCGPKAWGRMPPKPAGWKPALHPAPTIALISLLNQRQCSPALSVNLTANRVTRCAARRGADGAARRPYLTKDEHTSL